MMRGVLTFITRGDVVRWIAGPILDKELRVASRRRRNYVLRFVYLVLLAGFVAMVWITTAVLGGAAPSYRASQMAVAGTVIVSVVLWFQFLVLPLISIVMLSGSIGEEVRRRTLGVLMTTPITSLQIVLGKLASGLLQVVLLIAVSLPLLCVVRVFGGVPWDYVVGGLCVTVTLCVFAAALSMFFSISGRRIYAAVLTAILVMLVVFLVLPGVGAWLVYKWDSSAALGGVLARVPWVGGWLAGLVGGTTVAEAAGVLLLHVNPYVAMYMVSLTALSPGAMAGAPWFSWPVHCLVMLGASALLLALCVWKVRRVALAEITGDTPKARRLARRAARDAARGGPPGRISRVFNPPMVWKEFRTRVVRGRWRTALVAVFTLGLLGLTYWMSADYLDEPVMQDAYVAVFMVLGLLTTTVLAATGITAEKEGGTWPVLLGTPLSARAIVFGKAVGAVGRAAPVWGLMALHLVIFLVAGYVHPILLVHLAMIVTGVVVLLVGMGLFLGACLKRSVSAVAVNLGLALLVWAIAPMPLVLHPVAQAIVVTDGATGEHAAEGPALLKYEWALYWYARIHTCGVALTTFIVGATMLVHALIGLGLAVWAARLARRAVF